MSTTSATMMVRHCECADGQCTCVTHPFGDDRGYLGRVQAAGGKVKETNMSNTTPRVVGTRPPDPILLKAMLKVGIEASAIDGSGRLSVAQLDRIKATTDSISAKMQLTRLAELAGLLPLELQDEPVG